MYWYIFNAFIVLFFVWLTAKKYGTVLNPVTSFGGFYLITTVVAPMTYEKLGLFTDISRHSLNYTSTLSDIYLISIGSAFAVCSSPFKHVFRWLFRFMRPIDMKGNSSGLAKIAIFCEFVFLYLILMIGSGAGLLWITNTREAYQWHRASVGVLWSLSQATLMLAFICVMNQKGRTFRSLVGITLLFAMISLFLGSKGCTIGYFIAALYFAHFQIRRVSNRIIILIGVFLVLTVLGLQLYQGTASSMLDTIQYFDYFRNSAAFVDRFNEFGFHYGSLTLSNLWYYVPRSLYHSKPYVYGAMAATELLYPGAADLGNTPGLMEWIVGYADFGMIGVILLGLFTGFIAKGSYELYLERKDIQSMALFAQVSLSGIVLFPNAPFAVFFIWLMFQIAMIRFFSIFRTLPAFRLSLLTNPRIRVSILRGMPCIMFTVKSRL
jgi:oligosaccharide repeat unit polymerase